MNTIIYECFNKTKYEITNNSYNEGALQMLMIIGHNEGWEDTQDFYFSKFYEGYKIKSKKKTLLDCIHNKYKGLHDNDIIYILENNVDPYMIQEYNNGDYVNLSEFIKDKNINLGDISYE